MLYQAVVLTPDVGWQTFGPVVLSRAEVEMLSAQADILGLGEVYVMWAPTLDALAQVWSELKAVVSYPGQVLAVPSGVPVEADFAYWHALMDRLEAGRGGDRDKPYVFYLNNTDRVRWLGLLGRVQRGQLGGKDDGQGDDSGAVPQP